MVSWLGLEGLTMNGTFGTVIIAQCIDSGVEKIKQIEHYTVNPKEPIDEDTAPA